MTNKKIMPLETATWIVDEWLKMAKLKPQNTSVKDQLIVEIRNAIEDAVENVGKFRAIHRQCCPKCGGDLLEYGQRPSVAGGRLRFNSFQCNRCQDWFYRDNPAHAHFNERDAINGASCTLCKSDKVMRRWIFRDTEKTYSSFAASDKNQASTEEMKSISLLCCGCGLEWERENCIYCNSENVHLIKDRLNYHSGRQWWSYNRFYACFACGRSWLTSAGGSD